MEAQPTIWLSFVAGFLSFLSPCCLPLYPSYISYLSGVTFAKTEETTWNHRLKALSHTFFFVAGFSLVFFALGLSASLIGQIFIAYRNEIRIVGGAILVFLGLVLSQLIKPQWLMREKKWEYHHSESSYLGSLLVGISFAAGWTPCIGPILGSILVITATQPGSGVLFITSYILGFAIPFFILAFTLGSVRKLTRYAALLSKIGGYLMIVFGLMLMSNTMAKITVWLIRLYGGFTGF